jgi:carbohydrate diacid regulator
MPSTSFDRVACAISSRAAEVFQAHVRVMDERGEVIAHSSSLDDDDNRGEDGGEETTIRVPLRLQSRVGEVVIIPCHDDERIPPRLAQALIDLVVGEVAMADRLPNQSELKHRFIYDLLHGEGGDHGAVLRDARLLGMDLSPPRAVILIDAAEYVSVGQGAAPDDPSRRAQQIIRSVVRFFHLPNDTICAWNGDTEIAVLKASDTKNLETWVDRDGDPEPPGASWANLAALKRAGRALLARLRHDTDTDIAIGIGRYHPGIGGLARSYSDARAALTLGRRFHGQNRVHCLDGLGIAAFVGLSDENTKVGLARHLLGPLDHEPDLLQTLEAYFDEDCSQSATANKLSIHRNTLGYRFDKVQTLTGLDPRRFDDAVQVRLALVLRSLAA